MNIRQLALALSLGLAAPLALAKSSAALEIATETGKIRVTTIAEGLNNPWSMAFLPDGRMLVTERPGNLRIVDAQGKLSAPISGLPEIVVKGQGGLLDVVLAPDYATSHKIYFSYAEPAAKGKGNSTAVSYATLVLAKDGANRLEKVTRVFSQAPKIDSGGHFGSRLVWAPDGTLFITLGDRYSEKDDAQTLDNHHGKVVRINADGSVPAINPYVKTASALPEIWSYGHRNIQGAAINPLTQELWTGEHGPQGGDEINVDRAGKNYGWPVITYGENYGGGKIGEGTHKKGMEQPLYKWVPSLATAGFIFYAGDKFPQWKNNILLASLKAKTLVRLSLEGENFTHEERLLSREVDQRWRSVVQGPDGLVYLVSDEADGKIYQIAPVQ